MKKMIKKIANLSAELRKKGLPVSVRSTDAAVRIYRDLEENVASHPIMPQPM